jgi:hypothetical protein
MRGRRCLAIEAPPAEDKLAMLSEIAQEHGVEWDISSSAANLLPSGGGAPTTLPHDTAPLPPGPGQQWAPGARSDSAPDHLPSLPASLHLPPGEEPTALQQSAGRDMHGGRPPL